MVFKRRKREVSHGVGAEHGMAAILVYFRIWRAFGSVCLHGLLN
jgi:hypothetical protein